MGRSACETWPSFIISNGNRRNAKSRVFVVDLKQKALQDDSASHPLGWEINQINTDQEQSKTGWWSTQEAPQLIEWANKWWKASASSDHHSSWPQALWLNLLDWQFLPLRILALHLARTCPQEVATARYDYEYWYKMQQSPRGAAFIRKLVLDQK